MYLLTVYTPEDQVAMSCMYSSREEAYNKQVELESKLPSDEWVVAIKEVK